MNYSRILTATLLLTGISACVQLTPAGARVQIITEDQASLVAPCKYLGNVSVSSKDALRNNAAALSGDTAVISYRDVGSTSYIKGLVYDCSVSPITAPLHTEKPAIKELTTEEKADAEFIRKSQQCQSKGGAWIANQCVISIE